MWSIIANIEDVTQQDLMKERERGNLFSICDTSVLVLGLHQTACYALRQSLLSLSKPVVITDRHPADKPSVLQVEIDGAPSPVSSA